MVLQVDSSREKLPCPFSAISFMYSECEAYYSKCDRKFTHPAKAVSKKIVNLQPKYGENKWCLLVSSYSEEVERLNQELLSTIFLY